MAETVKLPLLDELLPSGLRYGANYLVEFESQSLWYETSLTLCAQALRLGIKTDYHTFTHPPEDIRRQLLAMGADIAALEADETFRIVDSYAVQTGVKEPEKVGRSSSMSYGDLKSVKMADWDSDTAEVLRGQLPLEVDRRRLHIDDNTSVLVQFNDEKSVAEHFRTLSVPYVRKLELAALHSVVAGVYSDAFYRQFESFCDGVLDFRSKEQGDRLGHFMRLRVIRGYSHDSSWRQLELQDDGGVAVVVQRPAEQSRDGAVSEERRLAAIMFTDTVGFTGLGQRDEALMMELLSDQRRILRPVFSKHRGWEVKTTGDGFLVEFGSALEAVECALDMQEQLRVENLGREEGRKLLVRIGIHLGDVIHTGSDVAGDAVNVASRIEALAPPGGACVTSQVYESVRNRVRAGFESMGYPMLKNVSTRIEVYRVSIGGPTPIQAVGEGKERVAVLPFRNISPDAGDEYFADGMTEEMISAVSRSKGLRVIARTSVMKYKGASKTAGEIGRELGVGSVLEGSVRKAGDKVRITVQLVDTKTEEPKWSNEYDRELKDIFAVQGDISDSVALALEAQVLRKGQSRVPETEAYVDYLRGRQLSSTRTLDGLKGSIDFFNSALARDPGFAKAYSGLADSYATLALLEFMAPREAFPKAKAAVERALERDGDLSEAHTSLGLIKYQYDWDWKGAEEEFRRAEALNPSYAPAHQYYADYLKAMGRFDEALSEISKAKELDPLSLPISAGLGHVLYLSRQYDRAIEQYKRAVELDPSFMQTHVWFGRPYLEKGMYEEALKELETGVKLSGEGTLALAMFGHGLGAAGRREEAMEVLRKLEEKSVKQYVPSYWVAVVYNGLKDREEVVAWLRRAYDERSSWLVWANVEPRFDWLRDDPGFASVMAQMGFPRR